MSRKTGGRYLSLVEKGQTIRGKPVAKLFPAESETRTPTGLEEKVHELETASHLRLGTRPFPGFKAVRAKGKLASRIILEGRR